MEYGGDSVGNHLTVGIDQGDVGPLRQAFDLLQSAVVVAHLGFVALVEMIYHFEQGDQLGRQFRLLGVELDVNNTLSWIGASAVFVAGAVALALTLRVAKNAWASIANDLNAKDAAS